MDAIEIAKGARELLSNPEHWTKGDFARDANGDLVDPASSEAVCFCLMGAIDNVSGYGFYSDTLYMDAADTSVAEPHRLNRAIHEIIEEVGFRDIDIYNDAPDRQHSEIIEVLDKAIAKLEAS